MACMKKTAFISLFNQTIIKRGTNLRQCYLVPVDATSFKGSQTIEQLKSFMVSYVEHGNSIIATCLFAECVGAGQAIDEAETSFVTTNAKVYCCMAILK